MLKNLISILLDYISILLVILVIAISFYGLLTDNEKHFSAIEIKLEDEKKELNHELYEEGNIENSGGASTVYIENVEQINAYLDLDMMLIYKELLTNYGILLPKLVTNDVETFYLENTDFLNKNFGIYSSSDLSAVNYLLDGLNSNDNLSSIKINDITQEGNLLKADLIFYYADKEFQLSHYINYVFIEGNPQLFIYN